MNGHTVSPPEVKSKFEDVGPYWLTIAISAQYAASKAQPVG